MEKKLNLYLQQNIDGGGNEEDLPHISMHKTRIFGNFSKAKIRGSVPPQVKWVTSKK